MSQQDDPPVDQFVTVVPYYHQHPPKQSPQFHPYSHTYHLGSEASSPEARMSLSGSSTGSYSIPRATLDPTLSYPEKVAGSASFALASRAEEGGIHDGMGTDSRAESHVRSSWTGGPSSLSDGHAPRGLHHDGPNKVTVFTPAEESSRPREPNAVIVLVNIPSRLVQGRPTSANIHRQVVLSMPVPFFTLCTALYTLFALFVVTLTTPLRLCPPTRFFRSTSFSTQLCQLLIPALRYHERLAQSSHSDHSRHSQNDPYTPGTTAKQFSSLWLVTVLLLAPFLSFGLLLAVWTAAFFWIFAMILGNPDGTERKDDGRAAVLGVNGWWQKWLDKSRKK